MMVSYVRLLLPRPGNWELKSKPFDKELKNLIWHIIARGRLSGKLDRVLSVRMFGG